MKKHETLPAGVWKTDIEVPVLVGLSCRAPIGSVFAAQWADAPTAGPATHVQHDSSSEIVNVAQQTLAFRAVESSHITTHCALTRWQRGCNAASEEHGRFPTP
jgi:hypothetical protein